MPPAGERYRRWLGSLREAVRGRGTTASEEQDLCFLVSAPRSGSTWTKRALNQHPEIYCTEQRLFGDFVEVWTDDVGTARRGLRITLDAYVEALAGPFDFETLGMSAERFKREAVVALAQTLIAYGRERSGKRFVVDKVTPYLGTSASVARAIRDCFPGAKMIYLLRDGRDVATSGVFDWLKKAAPGRAPSEFQQRRRERFTNRDAGSRLDRFFEPDEIETWARYWREPLDQIEAAANLTISYEALKQDQAAELKRVFQCLGVADDDAVVRRCVEESSFRKMSRGREPGEEVATSKVRKGVVGDWRNYFTRGDGERFHRLAGDLLLERGFEARADWYEGLPETLDL